jgi:hypothetical protein
LRPNVSHRTITNALLQSKEKMTHSEEEEEEERERRRKTQPTSNATRACSDTSERTSTLEKMDRAHFKNTSSTLSPVRADVSKNIKSEESKANEVSKRDEGKRGATMQWRRGRSRGRRWSVLFS